MYFHRFRLQVSINQHILTYGSWECVGNGVVEWLAAKSKVLI
jgi:hypothetical protein